MNTRFECFLQWKSLLPVRLRQYTSECGLLGSGCGRQSARSDTHNEEGTLLGFCRAVMPVGHQRHSKVCDCTRTWNLMKKMSIAVNPIPNTTIWLCTPLDCVYICLIVFRAFVPLSMLNDTPSPDQCQHFGKAWQHTDCDATHLVSSCCWVRSAELSSESRLRMAGTGGHTISTAPTSTITDGLTVLSWWS